MSSINTFIIEGKITGEVRSGMSGDTPVAEYQVASSDIWYEDGQRQHETTSIPVTTFGHQAQCDAKYLSEGCGVVVQGKIHVARSRNAPAKIWLEGMVIRYTSRAPDHGQHQGQGQDRRPTSHQRSGSSEQRAAGNDGRGAAQRGSSNSGGNKSDWVHDYEKYEKSRA